MINASRFAIGFQNTKRRKLPFEARCLFVQDCFCTLIPEV